MLVSENEVLPIACVVVDIGVVKTGNNSLSCFDTFGIFFADPLI